MVPLLVQMTLMLSGMEESLLVKLPRLVEAGGVHFSDFYLEKWLVTLLITLSPTIRMRNFIMSMMTVFPDLKGLSGLILRPWQTLYMPESY